MNDYAKDLAAFEEALKQASEGHYVLKLYVSGSSPRSAKAISNITSICDQYLAGRYDLDIIDVFQQPELAKANQLLAAPTLIKESPDPSRRLVGDFSDEDRVLYSLNIERKAT
jgi:circadian clock protein KaiB